MSNMYDIHLLDLPYEIIYQIIADTECDLYKESLVMDWNEKKGGLVKLNKRHINSAGGYFISREGAELFKRLPIKHGIVSLTKISMVCSYFNEISKKLWKPMYILQFRKNVPMKRNYSDNYYRKKYMDYLKKIYTEKYDYNLTQKKYMEKMVEIKQNNSAQYMKVIQNAVNLDDLSDNRIYYIDGLFHYSRVLSYNLHPVAFNIVGIENVINYRRKCLQDIKYYQSNVRLYKERTEYNKNKVNVIC